jgi:hypothetical protein
VGANYGSKGALGDRFCAVSKREVVICSFYTPDEYYGGHARELRIQLEELGLEHELLEIQKREG